MFTIQVLVSDVSLKTRLESIFPKRRFSAKETKMDNSTIILNNPYWFLNFKDEPLMSCCPCHFTGG